MPILLEPVVIGPLSTCSRSVRVRGQLSESTVTIMASGNRIGGGLSASADQHFSLDRPLVAGEEIGAIQEVGGDRSPEPLNPILVQKGAQNADEVGLLAPVIPVYDCAKCVWFNGAIPGAEIEFKVNGLTRATGDSISGDVILSFDPGLQETDQFEIRQRACGVSGGVNPRKSGEEGTGGADEGPFDGALVGLKVGSFRTAGLVG